ncbi:hypothetical protein L7F22_023232 [Adiantum nelumboides]|nr:hypothetical protein [Adiantum nelumboides]
MGPLPRTANGKLYILVAIDYMTRWVEAQSVAKVNEKTVSKFVYTHICCRFGTPLEIVSDNGPGFRRGLLTDLCEELKISHRHSTPYYPQSNGLVEKANGIIAGIIRKMVESKPKRWDNFLDGAIWAYRTTYRDATQFTPFHLVYEQEALQPIELNIPTIKLTGRQEQSNDEAWIDRLLNLVELEWKREAAYHCYEKKALQLKDKLNEGIKDKEIKEKSLVLRYNNALDNRFDAKFARRWEGPFIVKKAFTGGYYQLMDLNGKKHLRKVNGYRLKPYLSRILPTVFETKQVSKKTKKPTIEQHGSLEESLEVASLVARPGPPQYKIAKASYVRHLKADLIDRESKNTITFVVNEVFVNKFVEGFDVGDYVHIEGAYVKRKVWKDGGTSMWALYANASTLLVKAESFECCLRLYPNHTIKELLASKAAIEFAPTIAFTVVKIETSTRADGGDSYRLTIADGLALSDRANLLFVPTRRVDYHQMVDGLKIKGSYSCVAHNINVFKAAASTLFSVVDATLLYPLPKNLKPVFSQHLFKQVSSMGFGKKVFGTLEIVNINSLEVEYVCECCKGQNVSRQICNPFCYSCGKPVQILKVPSLQAKICLQNGEIIQVILQEEVVDSVLGLSKPFLNLFEENFLDQKSSLIALTKNDTFSVDKHGFVTA